MKKFGGTKSWVVTIGVTLLLALVAVPALSGVASAMPGPRGNHPIANDLPWAYCGNATWSNTVSFGNASLTWDASVALCTIFHATNTTAGVQMLEMNRTLGMNISSTFTNPAQTMQYHYAALELDVAFANVTNGSTVYSAGQPVQALGLLNASTLDQSSQEQSMTHTVQGATDGATLSVTGMANASVAFAPSLGLVPLNLTGVTHWNSTSAAGVSAAWQTDWAWTHTTLNGSTASASQSRSGNLSGTFPVQINGFNAPAYPHPFRDHMTRAGVILALQGPFDLRDGFVLVPHNFDMFGGASHGFDADSMGSATIASSETLYFGPGPHGPQLGAVASSFGADDALVNQGMDHLGGAGMVGASPSLGLNPAGTVVAQPVSVAQAQAESNQIAGHGVLGTASHPLAGVFLLGLVAAAVVVVVLGFVGWRAHARRRASARTTDRYVGYGPNGIPLGVIAPPPVQGGTGPEPGSEIDPNRPL